MIMYSILTDQVHMQVSKIIPRLLRMLKNVFRLSLIGLRVIRERDWLSFILENWTKLYLPTIRDLKLNQLISSLMRVFRELEMKRSNQT